MRHEFKPKGTCSKKIEFDLDENNVIGNIKFTDGCSGNLHGIATLAEGMDARRLSEMLKGTRCGRKKTSCPDQFALAIEEALKSQAIEEAPESLAIDDAPVK